MSDVPPANAGIASALVNLSLYVPGAIGLAVVGAVAAARTHTLTARGAPLADALVAATSSGCSSAPVPSAALLVALSVLRALGARYSSMYEPIVTMRCPGRAKYSTGLADVRDSARNSFLRHAAMPGSFPRTSVIFETK
jgi:hypothetical protein